MKFFFPLLFLISILPTLSFAAAPRDIQWPDLAPPGNSPQERLYQSFSDEEQGLAEWLLYMKETEPEEILPEDADLVQELAESRAQLAQKGFDLDAFAKARRISMTRINTDLNGKQIRLAGYLLPLEAPNGRIREFLLVPYVGACIHVPPPPPNQIVFATIGKEVRQLPDSLTELFAPVYVTGVLSTKGTVKDLFLVDGSGDIEMGYTMKVEKVEPYSEFSPENG